MAPEKNFHGFNLSMMVKVTDLGQEAAKEVSFKLKAKSVDKASEFRNRTAVILARETAHLKGRSFKEGCLTFCYKT